MAGCGSKKAPAPSPPNGVASVAFVAEVDNPWFPLPPGRTLRYQGRTDGVPGIDLFTVTHRTEADPRGRRDRRPRPADPPRARREDTLDYYAQDARGNVWYLGEDTKELDRRGRVRSRSARGAPESTARGPGIFMPAHPRVGQSFRQEYYKGEAEDHFRIVSIRGDRMRTTEWTPLEPGVRDRSTTSAASAPCSRRPYKGGDERWELDKVQTGR